MKNLIKSTALGMATASIFAVAAPAIAAPSFDAPHAAAPYASHVNPAAEDSAQGWRERRYNRDNYYGNGRRYDNRDNRYNRQTWRGRDGRYYCRRQNGTTGLVIGGAVGGLAGHEIAGRGDRTLGTILGVAGGALLGREIDKGSSRCR
jgi:hypothetical protein